MWDSPASCIQAAKAAGYHVIATHFNPNAVSIHGVDWTRPTAVILGNEREGVTCLTADGSLTWMLVLSHSRPLLKQIDVPAMVHFAESS